MEYLFLHGLGQGPESWSQTLSAMALPGEAVCPHLFQLLEGRDCTYENLYRAFAGYCRDIPEPVHLCGLSLGAVLALHYAADHPQRVRTLALIGGQCRMPKALLKLQSLLFRWMPDAAFRQMGCGKADFIALTRSMEDLDFTGDLGNISSPTLVLCGERDRANRGAAKVLADGIPGAGLQVVPGAGHEANLDAPEALAGLLMDFYSGT